MGPTEPTQELNAEQRMRLMFDVAQSVLFGHDPEKMDVPDFAKNTVIKDDEKGWRFACFADMVLTDDGTVRRVLGKPPLTVDGCLLGDGGTFFVLHAKERNGRQRIESKVNNCSWMRAFAYSTRDAAEAAKTSKEQP